MKRADATARADGASAPVAIRLDDLTLKRRRHPAVERLSGSFATGSLTAVVGPNGAGKSSLLDALAGRLVPSAGRVALDPALRGRIAYLPQQASVDRSFPLGVLDVAMLGHWASIGGLRAATPAQRGAAQAALDTVGLAGLARRLIGELSVGQMQRLLFARVLLQDARLILLDEPFNAIDARTTADLLAVVDGWHAAGRTVVAVLHDLEQVRDHFPATLLLARRPVAWGATAEVLQPANLAQARRWAEGWHGDGEADHKDADIGAADSRAGDVPADGGRAFPHAVAATARSPLGTVARLR